MKFLPYLLKHLAPELVPHDPHRAGHGVCASSSSARCSRFSRAINGQTRRDERQAPGHPPRGQHRLRPCPWPTGADQDRRPVCSRVAMPNWFGGRSREEGGQGRGGLVLDHRLEQLLPEPGGGCSSRVLSPSTPSTRSPPDQWQALLADQRRAPRSGPEDSRSKYGWKVGDTFYLESFIPVHRKADGPFEFVVRAIFDTDPVKYPGTDTQPDAVPAASTCYEATGRTRPGRRPTRSSIDDPGQAGTVERRHRRPLRELATPRPAPRPRYGLPRRASWRMAGNLALLLNGIGLAVTFTILLVTANTMSIAVRERSERRSASSRPSASRAGR